MGRVVLLNLLAVAAAALVLAPLAGASGDSKGPPCSNIVNGGTGASDGYVSAGTGATFNFSMILAAPACPRVTYTFYVSTDGGNSFTAIPGITNGTTVVTMPQQTYNSSPLPQSVCVYATSTKSGDVDVADRAPDSGCLTFVLNEFPGNSSFT